MNAGANRRVGVQASTVEPGGTIRLARYSVYPRAASEHAVQTGFTRNASGELLRLVTASAEAVGALLRVHIQDLDEREGTETLARVVACNQCGEGRFELTLESLDAHRPRFVRRAQV